LYVSNLPVEGFSNDMFKDIFKEFGEIDSANLNTNKPGSGFVSFKDHNNAKNALEKTNKIFKIGDTAILVMPHIYRKENDLFRKPVGGLSNPIVKNQKEAFKSNIFVRFLPKDVSEEALREKFKEAGKIASIKLKDNVKSFNGETFAKY